MSISIEKAPDALRFLLDGQKPSREIAQHVGWAPRTAGARMRSMETHGLVERVLVKRATRGSDAKYEWKLTPIGRSYAERIS